MNSSKPTKKKMVVHTFKETPQKNNDTVAVTYWKNLKALTVNPLEENKSFRASSLTEELHGGDTKEPNIFLII